MKTKVKESKVTVANFRHEIVNLERKFENLSNRIDKLETEIKLNEGIMVGIGKKLEQLISVLKGLP